jgi:uncharacterized membrane protein
METEKKKGILTLASSKEKDLVTMPINRLAILSDVIFALAMTSMIFAIDLPTAEDVSNMEELLIYFENRPPGTIIYLLSFLLVAVYWFKHLERFKYYKRTDTTHQWIEIGFLAFLMLVPLMNTWTMVLPGNPVPLTSYSLMMFLVGLFAFISWNYATKKKELVSEELSSDIIRNVKHESLVEPIIALVSIAMAWIKPVLWDITLFSIPVFFILQKRITRHYEKRDKEKMENDD